MSSILTNFVHISHEVLLFVIGVNCANFHVSYLFVFKIGWSRLGGNCILNSVQINPSLYATNPCLVILVQANDKI